MFPDCKIETEKSYQVNNLGYFVATFTSLVNHSCAPNVTTFTNQDREMIMVAIEPIKKDSQVNIKLREF